MAKHILISSKSQQRTVVLLIILDGSEIQRTDVAEPISTLYPTMGQLNCQINTYKFKIQKQNFIFYIEILFYDLETNNIFDISFSSNFDLFFFLIFQ